MRLSRLYTDERGTSAIEFAVTSPAYFLLLFGIIEAGLLLWTQLGLQHGAEQAARCATINSAICSNVNATQTYAAQQSFGINPPPSTFNVTTPACGNQVSANYTFSFFTQYFGLPTMALKAQACFPK
jgi:TadE-like protein